MSFNDLPAELLLNILSHLDNLDPLSFANRTLSITIADYQASQLRCRLARIRNVDLLVSIWSPPTFFRRRRGGGQTASQHVYVSQPQDLINVLCDPEMIPWVEAYIGSLESKACLAQQVAQHLVGLINFNAFCNSDEKLSFASTLILHLWSAQQRYSHDIDGYIASLHDRYNFRDLLVRDQYLADLPVEIQEWLVVCYDALSQRLRPPFGSRGPRGEGMGLQRVIVRVSLASFVAPLQ
jgi:hypothetical protein